MSTWQRRDRKDVTEERLVRAVEVLGEIMKVHGPQFSPLYESVEQELIEFRRRHQLVQDRAEPPLEAPARKRVRTRAA